MSGHCLQLMIYTFLQLISLPQCWIKAPSWSSSWSLFSFCRSRYRSHLDCCFGRTLHSFTLKGFLSINVLYFPLLPLGCTTNSHLHNLICGADRGDSGFQLIVHSLFQLLWCSFIVHRQMNERFNTFRPTGFVPMCNFFFFTSRYKTGPCVHKGS